MQQVQEANRRYVVITPCRDEAEYLLVTILTGLWVDYEI